MEMLVVMAIIAVLTAVAFPVFSVYVEKARASVCSSNRRDLRNVLTAAGLTGGADAVKTTWDEHKSGEKSAKDSCPDGGVISYAYDSDTHTVHVYCSRHAPGTPADPSDSFASAVASANITLRAGGRIDSGSTSGSMRNQILQQFADSGVDLAQLQIRSWAVIQTKSSLTGDGSTGSGAGTLYLWTSVDVETVSVGTKVPVLCYNATKGQYTVSNSNVGTASADTTHVIGINAENNGFGYTTNSKNDSYNYSTYAEAYAKYAELMETYNSK